MSRERLANAYDALAEAYAQVAHELRGTEPPAATERVPLPAAPAPTPEWDECPKHLKPFVEGKFGPYCPSTSDEGRPWANAKGYCSITPANAANYARTHGL